MICCARDSAFATGPRSSIAPISLSIAGCPYLHTIAELADVDADNRIRAAASAYVNDIRQRLRRAAAAAGADPAIGEQPHALLTGAMELAVAYRSSDPIQSARDAAARLMDAASATASRRTPRRSGRF